MPTLYLQCNMDRLGPAYESNQPYYLLTLSAAFASVPATADEVRNMLRPWTWKISGLSVYKQAAAGGAFTKVDHDLLPGATLDGRAALVTALDQELEAQLTHFGDTAPDFVWDPVKPKQTPWNGRIGRDWRSWVGHIGSYPGGIGSALNLAFVFVPHTAPNLSDVVLAAPQLVFDNVEIKPGDPATSLKEVTGLPGAYEWTYEGNTVKAFLNKLEPPTANVDTYINIETLWRNKLPLDGGGNWTEQLDDRLAQAFDGPERLLGWVRRAKGKPIPANFNDVLTNAFFRVVSPALDSSVQPAAAEAIWKLPAKVDSSLPPIPSGTPMPANFKNFLEAAITQAGANFPAEFPPKPEDSEGFQADWSVIQESFRQQTVLINLILQLWKSFFGAKWTAELQTKLTDHLNKISQLHLYLLNHSSGDTWRALVPEGVKAGEELSTAKLRVSDDLKAFGKKIWADGDKDWEDLLQEQVEKVMIQPEQIPGDSTSDGLLIQVDKIEAPTTDSTRDKQDYLRRITGVGVMLKHKDGPWRCLNMADVKVLLEGNPKPPPAPIDKTPKAIPYRFSYAAGLRQGFIKYLNQPLVAQTPWSSMSPSREFKPENGNVAEVGFLRYESPYKRTNNGAPEWLLERLIYGEDYVAAPFYFGNAGILPAELAATNGGSHRIPWAFKLPDAAVQLPAATELKYLRNCPVGLLRIAEADSFPPAIPEHVYPIASVIENDPEKRHPLLILTPSNPRGWNQSGRQSFSFSVRPPSLDVKVWDRWMPDSDINRNHRKAVLGQLHDLRFRLDSGLLGSADTTVDDPAVTGFEITAERLWPSKKSFAATTNPVFKPWIHPPTELSIEQKEAVKIKVMSAAITDPRVGVVENVFVLEIPDGEVWQVNFKPTIPAESRKRFVTEVVNQTEPLSFVVEVTQPLVNTEETAKQLYDSLKLERLIEENKLNVKLDPKGFTNFAPLVHRVELVTQRWRWDGRPVYEFPLMDIPQSGLPFEKMGELDEFIGDGMLFSSREDSDASIYPTQVEFAVDNSTPVTVREIDWTGKDGVLYYRLAVRVFSRYEGLLEEVLPVESSGVPGLGKPRHWKRYVRESVWKKRVPKPSVKLVLPLTESITSLAGTKGAAGWLVLIDEPWYGEAMAGLGESLRSEIVKVRLPNSLDEVRPQSGPDPTIELPEDPFASRDVSLPRPVGAIGSTFDMIAEAPLFAHSVFFQPPPVVKEDGKEQVLDLSFYFVKIRFQRVILGTDPSAPRTKALESEYTEGYWTQILPPAEWWFVKEAQERIHISELTFATGKGFIRKGQPATILPTGPQPQPQDSVCRFQLFGLVTQEVTDAFGRKNQERFDGLCSLQKLATLNLNARNKIRLIEVQFRLRANEPMPVSDTDQSLSELVKALFPNTDDPQDARGRIVRVSAPVTLE